MDLQLAVIILSAGASRRMGQPKLLLPWNGTSILGHLLDQWATLGAAQIGVVTAEHDQALNEELNRLRFPSENRITNFKPELGMFASIRYAAEWNGWDAGLTHWAIALGDQPHLRPDTLQHLIKFVANHPEKICQPFHNEHRRHPVILPESIFPQLAKARDENLKDFLDKHREASAYCEIDDPGLDLDIDSPADYEQAMKRFGGSGCGTSSFE